MKTQVKICGLNTLEAVDAAVAAGADYLGFIIFPKSPRAVTVGQAGALAQRKGRAKSVAVLVDPNDLMLSQILTVMRPDIIQLHGAESPLRCRDARHYCEAGVWKAFGVAGIADLEAARVYEGHVHGFVFDAKPPVGADRPGGWGEPYDYSLLQHWRGQTPWLLSGGLTPGTVADAITRSGAQGVDVASGVESEPGVKDLARIEAFIHAARDPRTPA